MGTLEFEAKFARMLKPQNFLVYPMKDAASTITIQSDTRYGHICLETGKVEMSQPHAGGAGTVQYLLDKHEVCFLAPEDLEILKNHIRSTGGKLVGGVVKTCNLGAFSV